MWLLAQILRLRRLPGLQSLRDSLAGGGQPPIQPRVTIPAREPTRPTAFVGRLGQPPIRPRLEIPARDPTRPTGLDLTEISYAKENLYPC